jgi:hypothetical protein
MRHLWGLAYEALARGYAALLTGADRHATAYVTRGFGHETPLYGISDVDLAVVIRADPDCPGRARQRVLDRYERLRALLPAVCATILDVPLVLESDDLTAATASVLTYRLDSAREQDSQTQAVYFGASSHADRLRLQERPGLRGPTAGWRRVAGAESRPPVPRRERSDLRIAAWLEIQTWWRWFLQACPPPERPSTAYLCVKVVAEPARVWLALCHGEHPSSRTEALKLAMRRLPEEETALRRALELERALSHAPAAPTAEFLRYLVRLSDRIARVLADDVASAGTTPVRLDWHPDEQPVLRPDALTRLGSLPATQPDAALLPLADWRALTRAHLRRDQFVPAAPDETIAPADLNPAELSDLVAALRAGNHGPYPALRSGALLVLASVRWSRTQLRGVHCELTDPVSFGLLGGRSVASYPDVPGWSAIDTARRAVAEHRAWLSEPGAVSDGGKELAMLITATRAALFGESLRQGRPELALTTAGTLRRLRLHQPAAASTADDVEDAYRRWRVEGIPPDERTVTALRKLVTQLSAYRSGD